MYTLKFANVFHNQRDQKFYIGRTIFFFCTEGIYGGMETRSIDPVVDTRTRSANCAVYMQTNVKSAVSHIAAVCHRIRRLAERRVEQCQRKNKNILCVKRVRSCCDEFKIRFDRRNVFFFFFIFH